MCRENNSVWVQVKIVANSRVFGSQTGRQVVAAQWDTTLRKKGGMGVQAHEE